MEQKVAVFRKEHFNAAHRLFCADWSDAENKRVFGACSNPNYHGHNYDLVVQVNGIPDPITGFVINTKDLSTIVEEEVKNRFGFIPVNTHINLFKAAFGVAFGYKVTHKRHELVFVLAIAF